MEVLRTIRVRGFPKEVIFKKGGSGKKLRGTYEVRRQYFVSWMDSKSGLLLRTFQSTGQTILRKPKHAQGGFTQAAVAAASTFDAYLRCMGGTDRFDQVSSYYDQLSKTLSWKLRVITHFFRGTCINSMIFENFASQRRRNIVGMPSRNDRGTVDGDSTTFVAGFPFCHRGQLLGAQDRCSD